MNKIIATPSESRPSTGNVHEIIMKNIFPLLTVPDLNRYRIVKKELSTAIDCGETMFRRKLTEFANVIQDSPQKDWREHLKAFDVFVGLYGADKMTIALAPPPLLIKFPLLINEIVKTSDCSEIVISIRYLSLNDANRERLVTDGVHESLRAFRRDPNATSLAKSYADAAINTLEQKQVGCCTVS